MAVAAAAVELCILALAAYGVLRARSHTAAEAAAAALLLPLVFLSALFQLAFIAGLPYAAAVVEILAVGMSLAAIRRHRPLLTSLVADIAEGAAAHPLLAVGAGGALAYLLLLALAVPPDSTSWTDLAPMALLESRGTIFPSTLIGGRLAAAIEPMARPLNQQILFHLLLRTGTDRGLGLLGFAAYLSIGFSTYALARRYAWPPTALTAALVVLSLPRLVVQASSPGVELMAAASSLLVIVSLYRLLEQPNGGDLLFLLLFLLFSVSDPMMGGAFPLILGALSTVLLYRRHGGRIWRRLIVKNRLRALAAIVPAVLLSQLWRPVLRLAAGGTTAVAAPGHLPNTGGLAGAMANLVRYGLETIDLTLPTESVAKWMFGVSPIRTLEGLYRLVAMPLFGQAGAAAPFSIRWLPEASLSWFGPLGCLLVGPAVIYAVLRGPRRIKAVGLALLVYAYLVTLIPAWHPGNARLFSAFFVCGGFFVAFFLPPWRLTNLGRHLLQAVSIGLLLYAGAMNASKPLIGCSGWLQASYAKDEIIDTRPFLERARRSIWKRVVRQRRQIAEGWDLFGDDRIGRLAGLIAADRSVGVLTARPERTYPLLMRYKNRIVPLSATASPADLRTRGIGYLLYLDSLPDAASIGPEMRKIWSPSADGALPGALFSLGTERMVQAPGVGPSARIPRRKISNPRSSVDLRKSFRSSKIFLLASHKTIPEKRDQRMSAMATGWRSKN
jgi:hypothetical protein